MSATSADWLIAVCHSNVGDTLIVVATGNYRLWMAVGVRVGMGGKGPTNGRGGGWRGGGWEGRAEVDCRHCRRTIKAAYEGERATLAFCLTLFFNTLLVFSGKVGSQYWVTIGCSSHYSIFFPGGGGGAGGRREGRLPLI